MVLDKGIFIWYLLLVEYESETEMVPVNDHMYDV